MMQVNKSLQHTALWSAANSGMIMPLANWLGGIRDYVIILAFLLLSISWILAFAKQKSTPNPVSFFLLVLSGFVGIVTAILFSWFGFLIYSKNLFWYINYIIYLLCGFLYLHQASVADGGGHWLVNIKILSAFLIGYSLSVLILYYLYTV